MCGGGGLFGTVLSVVGVVTGQPELITIGSGLNAVEGVASGNPLQAIGGVLGMGGAGDLASIGGDATSWGSPAWMAAQDAAAFGDAGVSALGNSLGYSLGTDWVSPTLDSVLADPSGMANTVSNDAWNQMLTQGINPQDTINSFYDPSKFDTSGLMDRFSGIDTGGLHDFYSGTQDFSQGFNSNLSTLGQSQNAGVSGMSPLTPQSTGLDFSPSTDALAPTADTNTYDVSDFSGASAGNMSTPGKSPLMQDLSGNDFSGPMSTTPELQQGATSVSPSNITNQPKGLLDLFMNKDSLPTLALKGLGGIDSYMQNQKAMSMMKDMYNKSMSMADPFASDRALASNTWQSLVGNPNAAWDRYIGGQGQDFINNAAATYAKAGRRNMLPTLMSQAHQQYMSNFLPNYMKSVNPSQFGTNGAMVGASFAPAMAGMVRNSNAPLYNAAAQIFDNENMKNTLSDLFNG